MRETLVEWSAKLHARMVTRSSERGDLVGWLLIAVMTAGLVVVVWQFMGNRLMNLVQQAINEAATF